MLQWKAENGLSDKGFGNLLNIIKQKLPKDNEFIKSLGNETFGWGLDRMIQDAYRFLVLNYNPTSEDEIYLLGFSRGAYIVRCLASFMATNSSQIHSS